MLFEVCQIGVSPTGLHRLEIEATSEAEAKDKYETQRGLVKGVNALAVKPLEAVLAKADESPSPFGRHRSDRYEPFEKPVPKPVAAESVSESEEVLIVSN